MSIVIIVDCKECQDGEAVTAADRQDGIDLLQKAGWAALSSTQLGPLHLIGLCPACAGGMEKEEEQA